MTKVKYIALGHIIKRTVRIWRFIIKMSLDTAIVKSITLYSSKEISITLTKNIKSQY